MKNDRGDIRSEGKKDNKNGSQESNKRMFRWALQVLVITIFLSAIISVLSDFAVMSSPMWVAFIILVLLIVINMVSDMLGVAVTIAVPAPFLAMSAKRVKGGRGSLFLIQNADRVANICSDVIGDICGIVSGATGAVIAINLYGMLGHFLSATVIAVGMSALVSGLTVSLKAIAKDLAIRKNKEIVEIAGRLVSPFIRNGGRKKNLEKEDRRRR